MTSRFAVVAWFVCCCAAAVPSGLHAQERTSQTEPAAKPNARKASSGAARAKSAKKRAEAPAPKAAESSATPPAQHERKSEAAAQADDADVRKEGDKDVKVLEFSGLDIEGQLKTPQMLYFLRRLRAEFGRPKLPHRSFLPELDQSTKEEIF
jgi:hypothetical protein